MTKQFDDMIKILLIIGITKQLADMLYKEETDL